jgi:hypothetical protein
MRITPMSRAAATKDALFYFRDAGYSRRVVEERYKDALEIEVSARMKGYCCYCCEVAKGEFGR